jgi:ubiquinone/menaquinone biosynthesis C-methylase UbiE
MKGSLGEKAFELLTALSMTIGRGRLAGTVADAVGLSPGDVVVDIGCGPGTAVREAARRVTAATGVDPSPLMLRLARQISGIRRTSGVSWRQGRAEELPVPDAQATVAWAISSAHHWNDLTAGLGEARRVLAPAGRLFIAERLVKAGARGHAAHGLSTDQAEELARQMTAAGFSEVSSRTARAGHRQLVIVYGMKSPAEV